jgi:hypothetical protein
MNIFALSTDPIRAAQMVCDRHASKMCVETAQMMASALLRNGFESEDMPLTSKGTPYKGGYKHHPCTVWAGDNWANFLWLAQHGLALCDEFKMRYGEGRVEHACRKPINKMLNMAWNRKDTGIYYHMQGITTTGPFGHLLNQEWPKKTAFAMAMPDEFKRDDGKEVLAYREYYKSKVFKDGSRPTWAKGRSAPEWWELRVGFQRMMENLTEGLDGLVAQTAEAIDTARARRALGYTYVGGDWENE